MDMVKVKIVGAGGYGGVGIVELLLGHPQAEIVCLIDVVKVGTVLSDIYPHLKGLCDLPLLSPESPEAAQEADVVFFSTPDGVAMEAAGELVARGVKVIDFSGDFRFQDLSLYNEYARRLGRSPEHLSPDLLAQSSYGLTELHREQVKKARVVGNPGCFAVSCILGLAPAVTAGILELDSLICDCKTGVSGAGRKAQEAFHYPSRYENMNTYKLGGHQHVMEIEHELSRLTGDQIKVTFTPQVVPLSRGIMSTLYGKLKYSDLPDDELTRIYEDFYCDAPFVRMLSPGMGASNTDVRGTNFCNISVHAQRRTGQLLVISHIDNLVKGQAGSALQNMNVMMGLAEGTGLLRPGMYP